MTDSDGSTISDDEFEAELDRQRLRPDEEGVRGWTPGRIGASILVVAMIGWWMWALSPLAPRGHPDQLNDPTFALAAQPLCAVAEERVKALPRANTAVDMADRADQVDAGTVAYRELIEQLEAIMPPAGTEDGDVVRAWLADYSTYLDDRDRYAADLRNGIDEAFTVTRAGRNPISVPIDEFVRGNEIPECFVPIDV